MRTQSVNRLAGVNEAEVVKKGHRVSIGCAPDLRPGYLSEMSGILVENMVFLDNQCSIKSQNGDQLLELQLMILHGLLALVQEGMPGAS